MFDKPTISFLNNIQIKLIHIKKLCIIVKNEWEIKDKRGEPK